MRPYNSRLKKIIDSCRKDSCVFFSGSFSLVEGEMYLELHNLSYINGIPRNYANTSTPTTFTSTNNQSLPWDSLRVLGFTDFLARSGVRCFKQVQILE